MGIIACRHNVSVRQAEKQYFPTLAHIKPELTKSTNLFMHKSSFMHTAKPMKKHQQLTPRAGRGARRAASKVRAHKPPTFRIPKKSIDSCSQRFFRLSGRTQKYDDILISSHSLSLARRSWVTFVMKWVWVARRISLAVNKTMIVVVGWEEKLHKQFLSSRSRLIAHAEEKRAGLIEAPSAFLTSEF